METFHEAGTVGAPELIARSYLDRSVAEIRRHSSFGIYPGWKAEAARVSLTIPRPLSRLSKLSRLSRAASARFRRRARLNVLIVDGILPGRRIRCPCRLLYALTPRYLLPPIYSARFCAGLPLPRTEEPTTGARRRDFIFPASPSLSFFHVGVAFLAKPFKRSTFLLPPFKQPPRRFGFRDRLRATRSMQAGNIACKPSVVACRENGALVIVARKSRTKEDRGEPSCPPGIVFPSEKKEKTQGGASLRKEGGTRLRD